VEDAYWDMVVDDITNALGVLRAVYDSSNGGDGFVSIEVAPSLAHDTAGTIRDARMFHERIALPNLMVKIPATAEGVPAIERCIADGLNINVTLIFSLERYDQVMDAYIGGLEKRAAAKKPIDRIASVASFFVSRVDTAVDKQLESKIKETGPDQQAQLKQLLGKAAIANAKLAYALFQKKFTGGRWDALAAKGARVQRPLWASTSTKNPAYRDVMYVEQLIGPHTVNTLPPATLDAFRDHGEVKRTVDRDVDVARKVIADLEAAGISLAEVTAKLLKDGIGSFQKSFDGLLANLEKRASVATR